MRDRMERLAVMPFPFGCASHSSISVKLQNPKMAKSELCNNLRGEENIRIEQMKNSISLLPLPKATLSAGLQRLIRSLKSLSQLFVDKEEFVEMEIGLPTDVKHVAHIGLDGSTTPMKSWEVLQGPELLPLPSISLQDFELAMAAQGFAGRQMDIN
ncbi:CRIB domain-containing protein RIC4-like [Nymphaea colorata]|nr:CRIB domain-containing protein RIC4-like [Nymphaea colorata]